MGGIKSIGRRSGKAAMLAITSVALLGGLGGLLAWLGGAFGTSVDKDPLVVYCAAGVRPPLEEIAEQYEKESYGAPIRIRYGPSGELLAQIEIHPRGDLYIPAGVDPFISKGREKGLVAEAIPLAKFSLVLGVKQGNPKKIDSLDDLFADGVAFALANENAAVGKKTESILKKSNNWERVHDAAKVFKPTVTDIASDVRDGVGIDAAFVWDSTARQYGLDIVALPELQGGESTITAGVLVSSPNSAAALRFARYVASPEKGQPIFKKHHYEQSVGDPWAVRPKITLFSGGVNRLAIEKTIETFQQREGCDVRTIYNGCGVLVGQMKLGEKPDAYFACDISFVDQVQDSFLSPVNISRTDMVLLVQKGNPKNINSIEDLGRDGLRVGLADEELSALGFLSKRLLQGADVYDDVIRNRRATTPTADLLVTQLTNSDKLDAAIVYRANCTSIGDKAEIIKIDHASAIAVQPFAVHADSPYPQLTTRLLDAISSATSQQRFEGVGFEWVLDQ
jgi:molybdenum ABC transporter molybdate-binding protein